MDDKKMKLHGLKPVVSSPLSSAKLKSAEAKDFRIHPRQRRGLLRRRIKVRVRLIIIKNDKILLSFVKDENFHFFIGGKMEFGETLLQVCLREVAEECDGAKFNFKKILYIRDYIKPEKNEHSLELYVLGDIDKFEELEGLKDPEFGDNHWQTWVDLAKLESLDIRPKKLVKLIIEDYKSNFSGEAKYLGEID